MCVCVSLCKRSNVRLVLLSTATITNQAFELVTKRTVEHVQNDCVDDLIQNLHVVDEKVPKKTQFTARQPITQRRRKLVDDILDEHRQAENQWRIHVKWN